MQREANTELAIPDLQRRLMTLGYRLGDEAEQGLFGEKTAAAVAAFKESTGLGFDDALDQTTWTALKDASMQMGDRLLYLHMPHFRGRDVGCLQGALSSMGFVCVADDSFGPETEQALREFQSNMGLEPSGIFADDSLLTIYRLKHLWEGKRGCFLEGRALQAARSVEVLEASAVCVFGIDEQTRAIANRIANLARATTLKSQIVSVAALSAEPSKDMLLVGLEQGTGLARGKEDSSPNNKETQTVLVLSAADVESELIAAVHSARQRQNRITLVVENQGRDDATAESQETAARILDLLCKALAETSHTLRHYGFEGHVERLS